MALVLEMARAGSAGTAREDDAVARAAAWRKGARADRNDIALY